MATGGIALNGSSQYLRLNSRIVSGFPFSLVCWVSQNASGSSQFVIAQQQSNGDRYAAAWLDANGTSKYANLRTPGNSTNAIKTAAPHPDTTLRLFVAVFASTTSRTVYFGDNSGATATTSVVDDIANHDRITIGAWEYNNGGPGLYLNGTVAEAHIFNTALSASDVSTLLTTPPEQVTGWVDGWTLATASDLTSIGGTRTLTAFGSPTTGSRTLPYTRSTPASMTGSITLDAIDPTGTLGLNPSSLGGSITLDAIAPTGTLGIAPGSVTTLPFSRNTGSRPTGIAGVAVAILSDDANMTRLAGATSLAQDGSGRITYTGAGLPSVGTSVLVVTREPDGRLGLERYTVG